jgi:transcriptional regulator with XRE-family HTH domain
MMAGASLWPTLCGLDASGAWRRSVLSLLGLTAFLSCLERVCKLTLDEAMKTLGERIRELREERDLSVRELARRIEVSPPFLSDVELGRRHPSEDVLERLAAALSTKVDELRKFDARPPVQELRRMAASDPAMGFALRKVVDQGVSAEELLEFLKKHRGKKG